MINSLETDDKFSQKFSKPLIDMYKNETQFHNISEVDFFINNHKVSEFELGDEKSRHKLPFLPVQVLTGNDNFISILGLVDSGCSASTISQNLCSKLPEFLRKHIQKVHVPMNTAIKNSETVITGRIKLMIALKEHEMDKYPLIFSHHFFICEGLNRDMYIGSDLLANPNFKVSDNGESIVVKYPKEYVLPTDLNNESGVKTIDFHFLGAEEAEGKCIEEINENLHKIIEANEFCENSGKMQQSFTPEVTISGMDISNDTPASESDTIEENFDLHYRHKSTFDKIRGRNFEPETVSENIFVKSDILVNSNVNFSENDNFNIPEQEQILKEDVNIYENDILVSNYVDSSENESCDDSKSNLLCNHDFNENASTCTDHKSHCKKVTPNDEDKKLPNNFTEEIDKLTRNTHQMTTRSKVNQ